MRSRHRRLPCRSCPRSPPTASCSTSRCCRRTSTRARARHSRRGEDGPVPRKSIQGLWSSTGKHRRHLHPEGAARRTHPVGHATADHCQGCAEEVVSLVRRLRRVHEARGRHRRDQQLGAGVRWLRRHRAGVSVGRLQGHRRQGQDHRRAGERSAGARRGRSITARCEAVQRHRNDLLRPLDLQVRGGRAPWGRRHLHRARDRTCRLSLLRRAGLPRRAVRSGDAG